MPKGFVAIVLVVILGGFGLSGYKMYLDSHQCVKQEVNFKSFFGEDK